MDYDESSSPPEEPLPGTFTTLTKVGNTVRRSRAWTPAAHALLRHLERMGFDGALRALGVDDRGREVLTYIPPIAVGRDVQA